MKSVLLSAILFLFILDLNAKIIYVEPVQNAKYVSINNNIIIGFEDAIKSSDINSLIKVTGSVSGIHTGKIILTENNKKLLFQPYQPFAYNETVEVTLNNLKTSLTSNNRLAYTFHTQVRKVELNEGSDLTDESEYSSVKNYSGSYSVLPQLTVTISNNPTPGHIFINNFATPDYTPHIIIANNDGTMYYSRELTSNGPDFKRQPNGLMTYFLVGPRVYYAEDEQYNIVDSFYCGNGYTTDNHELKVLNNGHALLMSYDRQPVDMSLIVPGGNPNAIVIGLIIQEIDENKNVVFQWRSWDHYNILDAYNVNFTLPTVDYAHGNAIEPDNDGNLMISSRNLNEITKISRSTGEMIWRMGGANNQFTFVNDTIPFIYQHDIRRLENGNVTLYDNGNFRNPGFSRAVEYHLDEVNKVATLVWQYRNNPDIVSGSRGSVQRLKNGNTLICWGSANPNYTEVTPSGDIALEMSLPTFIYSYRAFKDEADLTLNMKLAIEGFYNTSTNTLNMNDTVRAYLRSAVSPYGIIDSAKSIVDSTNFNGNFRYYNVSTGTYYISTLHRNGLETWSKSGGESFVAGGVYNYDLTNASSNAYGNNLVLKGSKYCIYSGNVNQDGVIDLTDVIAISNDALYFVNGYVNTDVNGDRVSDLTDVIITYNNSTNFVSLLRP